MTPSLFLKIEFSPNKIKSEFRHRVGTHRENARSTVIYTFCCFKYVYIYIHIYLVNCMYSYHKFHGPFFGMVHHITKLTFQFSYFFSLFLAHLIYFNLNLFYFMNLYILVCVSLIIFSNPLSFSFVFSYERLLKFHI